jgi:hypothetical protein
MTYQATGRPFFSGLKGVLKFSSISPGIVDKSILIKSLQLLKRSRMRFGTFNGWALVALGAFLILVQFALISIPRRDRQPAQATPEAEDHKTSFLPSVLGGVFLLAGAALILKSKVDLTAAARLP